MSNNVYDVGSSLPINTKFGSQMSWLLPNTTNIVKTSSTEALKEERAKLKWITKPYKEQKKLNFADTREKKIVINYGVSFFERCPTVLTKFFKNAGIRMHNTIFVQERMRFFSKYAYNDA